MVALDNLSNSSALNLQGRASQFVDGSFCENVTLRTLAGDAVVHLGAQPTVPRSIANPIATHEANATGTLRVLMSSRDAGVEYVVVASSSSIYGANPALPKRETMLPMPMSSYAVSKLATEQYTLAWQYSYGMRTSPLASSTSTVHFRLQGTHMPQWCRTSSKPRCGASRSPSTATECKAATSLMWERCAT